VVNAGSPPGGSNHAGLWVPAARARDAVSPKQSTGAWGLRCRGACWCLWSAACGCFQVAARGSSIQQLRLGVAFTTCVQHHGQICGPAGALREAGSV
jgi:hypothetical protein